MMIFNRGKISKSETPSRATPQNQKITQLVGISKKSDPFLKQLRQAFDKENLNPNVKENRVKSQNTKIQHQGKSPNRKTPTLKQTKPSYQTGHQLVKQPDQLSSNSKYSHSAELSKNLQNTKNSNRKNTQKDEHAVSHFEQEYYSKKEDRREKKMRVTLKDVKKHRKSINESQQDYTNKINEDTKDSLKKDIVDSGKDDLLLSEQKSRGSIQARTDQVTINQFPSYLQLKCENHPQKQATHRLVEGESCTNYCKKCAVTLVTNGIKLQQIMSDTTRIHTRLEDLKQDRQQKLQKFLTQVKNLSPWLSDIWGGIRNYRSLVQKKFEEQTSQLKNYYNQIRKQVQESYKKSQMNLKMYFESAVQQLQKNEQVLTKNYQDLKNFQWDIEPNQKLIVDEDRVTQFNFQEIIANYYTNLRVIQMSLKELSEYNYCIYQYYYDTNNVIVPNLRDMIAPQIRSLTLRDRVQTAKKTLQQSIEKQLDPFRLSFGKKLSEYQQR